MVTARLGRLPNSHSTGNLVVTASREPIRGTEDPRAPSMPAPTLTDKKLARTCTTWFCDHTLAGLIETNLLDDDTDEDNNHSSALLKQPTKPEVVSLAVRFVRVLSRV
jgi:hypothetical protein